MKVASLFAKCHCIFLGIAAIGLVCVTTGVQRIVRRPDKVPVLHCPDQIDLGDCPFGGETTVRFSIANGGQSTLEIDTIRTSCTCSKLEETVDGVLKPIESIRLEPLMSQDVVYRVTTPVGAADHSFRTRVTFKTNDPDRRDFGIDFVVARLLGGFITSPVELIFPPTPVGKALELSAIVYDTAPTARVLRKAVSQHPDRVRVQIVDLSAESRVPNIRKARPIGCVKATIDTTAPAYINQHIQLFSDDSEFLGVIPVVGQVIPEAVLVPPSVVLPRIVSGRDVYTASCICGIASGSIDGVKAQPPVGVTVKAIPVPGTTTEWLVRVEGDPKLLRQMRRVSVPLAVSVQGREWPLELTIFVRESEAEP